MRKIHLTTDQYYHIYNRGAGKLNVFKDDQGRFNFLRKIRELNNKSTSDYRDYLLRKINQQEKDRLGLGYPKPSLSSQFCFDEYFDRLLEMPKLVEIICYNLLDNHYHLILKQLVDNGISGFMHKLGTSYTKYFNNRYKSSGILFQGNFQAYPIHDERKLCWLSAYVNCNYQIHKLGLAKEWQFSSYLDYLNLRNGKLASKNIILELFKNNISEYEKYCQEVIKEAQDVKKVEKMLMD